MLRMFMLRILVRMVHPWVRAIRSAFPRFDPNFQFPIQQQQQQQHDKRLHQRHQQLLQQQQQQQEQQQQQQKQQKQPAASTSSESNGNRHGLDMLVSAMREVALARKDLGWGADALAMRITMLAFLRRRNRKGRAGGIPREVLSAISETVSLSLGTRAAGYFYKKLKNVSCEYNR